MTVYVIDGQGGGIGRSLIERLRSEKFGAQIVALGTNSAAAAAMRKAGADAGATGENAVVHCCAKAREEDLIAGPLGIMIANAMYGEISPAMARAVGESDAHKILVPVSRCHASVAGAGEKSLNEYIEDAVRLIQSFREDPKR